MQVKLVTIVAEVKIGDIQKVTRFPDWLGYIGLVMYHCASVPARRILSDSFLPQFIDIVKHNTETHSFLLEKQRNNELPDLEDLNKIEKSLEKQLQ